LRETTLAALVSVMGVTVRLSGETDPERIWTMELHAADGTVTAACTGAAMVRSIDPIRSPNGNFLVNDFKMKTTPFFKRLRCDD
jgi:hypothetical protein